MQAFGDAFRQFVGFFIPTVFGFRFAAGRHQVVHAFRQPEDTGVSAELVFPQVAFIDPEIVLEPADVIDDEIRTGCDDLGPAFTDLRQVFVQKML